MAETNETKTNTTSKTTETATDGRKASQQVLQAVDVAVGTPPTVAENVRSTADTWRNSETRSKELETIQKRVKTLRDRQTRTSEIESLRKRFASEVEKAEAKGGDIRKEVTEQLIGQARKARERVEPVYKERVEPVVKKRVEPVYKERVEPVVRKRVEPLYRERVEPAVKAVRERI